MSLGNSFLFLSCALAGFALGAPLSGQAGTVFRHRKVCEMTGAFPGGLDDNDQMGRAVISPGDIDGDGLPDLVSGAIGDDDGGIDGAASDTGALWVHFMNKLGTTKGNAKISMTSGGFASRLDSRDQLGRALAPLGDLDEDGIPDIAVGACRDDDGGVNHGAVYLLFLRRDGTVREQRKISDTQGNFQGVLEDLDEFGRSIANLGDLDGNGVTDLAVGATGDDDGGVDLKGAIWILFLNPDGTVLREQKISDTQGNFLGIIQGGDLFGFSLASLGDLDGDGVTEIVTGCPKDDDGGVRKGCVWILFLRADGTVKGHRKISDVGGIYGLMPGDEFGSAVAGLGDLDGDGVPDMAVGAILDDGAHDDQGAVWINFLNPDASIKSKLRINDEGGNFTGYLEDGDWFGAALHGLPDLDGNGIGELAVGARFDDDGGLNTGSVWVLYLNGVANVPPTPAFDFDVSSGNLPLAVQFDERSSAGATQWDWDFGDGTTSTQRDPQHTYLEPGVYTVTLTVTGLGGSAQKVVEDAIEVRQPAMATLRNGSGQNTVCYQSTTLPILGTTWMATVDVAHHPGAGIVVLRGYSAPNSGVFRPAGEVLTLAPTLGGVRLFTLVARSHGVVGNFSVAVPPDPDLVGLTASTQATILGGARELTNAIDLVIGY